MPCKYLVFNVLYIPTDLKLNYGAYFQSQTKIKPQNVCLRLRQQILQNNTKQERTRVADILSRDREWANSAENGTD